jgi:perosamine synthetase
MRIPLSRPDIGEREIECVVRVLRSGQLSLGPCVTEFEEKFAAYAGTRYAVVTNSGTSALHLGVKALGIGPEDDVLTSAFSFVASANCILYERASPVFVDIDPATLNLDPRAIQRTIARDYVWDARKGRHLNRRSGHTLKALLPVHVFGVSCEMAPILELAREYGLRVLEDACEALGAEYRGQRVGTFGDAAVFAFYPNKQMTCAEGGMLVTDDARIAGLCRSLRNQGRDEDSAWLRHVRLGYNYRLSDLHCALGLAQLERIEELLAARERVAAAYSRGLCGIRQIKLPSAFPDAKRSWFVYVVQLPGRLGKSRRDALMSGLRERGIACQAYFPAIHLQPFFQALDVAPGSPLPLTESASDRCLALPFFSTMTEEQVTEVCSAIREILDDVAVHDDTVQKPFYDAALAADSVEAGNALR